MMKRRWLALLALCCVLFVPCGVLAEGDGFTVSAGQADGALEKDITLDITISGCKGLDSLQLCVNYDLTALKLVSAEGGSLLENGLHVLNTDEAGLIAFAYAGAEGLAVSEGTLLTLTFRPLSDQGSAIVVTDVLATTYDAAAGEQNRLYGTVQDGYVTVAGGEAPAPKITPWIAETPAPTPEPTPEPTSVPTEAPQATEAIPENVIAALDEINLLPYILGAAALLLVIVIALIVVWRNSRRS